MINLPRDLGSLEPRVRETVNARVARGRLVINVHHQTRPAANGDHAPALDVAAARAYYSAMLALQRELGAQGEVSIETILRAPGVMRLTEEPADAAQLWPQIESALRQALDELIAMRTREGSHLADDLRARLKDMRARPRRHPRAPTGRHAGLPPDLARTPRPRGRRIAHRRRTARPRKSSSSPTAATSPRRSRVWKATSANSSICWRRTSPSAARWISSRRKWRAS